MADSSQCVEKDELYSKLHRLITARKKYPTMINDIERNKFELELKSYENIKVYADNDELNEIKLLNDSSKKLTYNLKNSKQSFVETEEKLLKSKKNMAAIESFLELQKTLQS